MTPNRSIRIYLLVLSSLPVLAQAGMVPNPGGAVVVTNSTTNEITFIDTPITQRVDKYLTTLTAILNGQQTVFQQTFATPFSDPSVQAAVQQASAVLVSDKATPGAPFLGSTATVLQSSLFSFGPAVLQGCVPVGVLQGSTQPFVCTNGSKTVTPGPAVDTFGPNTIKVGENQQDDFFVNPGQLDININTDIVSIINRNAITTNTFLTTQTYELDGTSSPINAVPEPKTWTLLLGGLAAFAIVRHRQLGRPGDASQVPRSS